MISKVSVGNVAINSQNISNKLKSEDIQKKDIKGKEDSKIESIKKSIENGTYKIDLDKVANKIADSLL